MKSALNKGQRDHTWPTGKTSHDGNHDNYFGCLRILVLVLDVAVMIYNTSNTKGCHGNVLAL